MLYLRSLADVKMSEVGLNREYIKIQIAVNS